MRTDIDSGCLFSRFVSGSYETSRPCMDGYSRGAALMFTSESILALHTLRYGESRGTSEGNRSCKKREGQPIRSKFYFSEIFDSS